jgi:hypothetical protein
MEAIREYRTESIRPETSETQIFDMTHPEGYRSGVKVLDNFLDTIRCKFQSHTHIFPHVEPDKVQSAATRLCRWNNRPDQAQRQTLITNPVVSLRKLQRDSDPSLEDFKAIS